MLCWTPHHQTCETVPTGCGSKKVYLKNPGLVKGNIDQNLWSPRAFFFTSHLMINQHNPPASRLASCLSLQRFTSSWATLMACQMAMCLFRLPQGSSWKRFDQTRRTQFIIYMHNLYNIIDRCIACMLLSKLKQHLSTGCGFYIIILHVLPWSSPWKHLASSWSPCCKKASQMHRSRVGFLFDPRFTVICYTSIKPKELVKKNIPRDSIPPFFLCHSEKRVFFSGMRRLFWCCRVFSGSGVVLFFHDFFCSNIL